MLFSIIVPIYKVEDYIERCVDSLRMQTFLDIEIILVDDGSPDNCPQICDKYTQMDSRIKVIHKTNGGLSDARNFGLHAATGEYIIFVDSDDYVDLDMCEKILPYAKQGHDLIIGDAIVEGGKAFLDHTHFDDSISGKEYLLRAYTEGKAPMAAWLNVYKKTFLEKHQLEFKKGILHEDEEFTPRAFLAAESVCYTGVPFYHYMIRENSITTKKDKRKNAEDLYNTCCELERIYRNLEETDLQEYLLNSLVDKQLNMFQIGELYRYGAKYIHKDFVRRNAKTKRTRMKALLYCFSPRAYWLVHKMVMH